MDEAPVSLDRQAVGCAVRLQGGSEDDLDAGGSLGFPGMKIPYREDVRRGQYVPGAAVRAEPDEGPGGRQARFVLAGTPKTDHPWVSEAGLVSLREQGRLLLSAIGHHHDHRPGGLRGQPGRQEGQGHDQVLAKVRPSLVLKHEVAPSRSIGPVMTGTGGRERGRAGGPLDEDFPANEVIK